MDKQKLLLQGLWRKAGASPEALRLPCSTRGEALRLRFALYNAVRKVREGKEPADEALQRALEEVTLSFEDDAQTVLVMEQKVRTGMMQVVVAALGAGAQAEGVSPVPATSQGPIAEPSPQAPSPFLKTPEQIEEERSLERLREKLAAAAAAPSARTANPYYTRN